MTVVCGEVRVAALRRSFGVPDRWLPFVPVAAGLVATGLLVAGAPTAAAPAVAAETGVPPAALEAAAATDGPLTAPDDASARTIARLQDEPVEVLAQRTEFGSVFALPDGTMAAGHGSGPVWVRRGGDGTNPEDWAPVDLTLQRGDDGVVRPVAHTGDLTFAGESTGSEAEPVDVVTTEDPATGVVTRVQWDGDLPTPTLDGRRATYADVQPGVDLVFEATSTGFAQFFVLDERPEAGVVPALDLTVVTDGADLQTQADGGLAIVDEGTVLATAPVPQMWDAEADRARAYPVTEERPVEDADAPRLSPMPAWVLDPGHGRETSDAQPLERVQPEAAKRAPEVPGDIDLDVAAGTVEVERAVEQPASNVVDISLVPQDEFLQDPATTYPVVVDPDVNFNWGFDTYVLAGYNDDRSGHWDMQVGTYDGGAHVGRAFLTFPVGWLYGKQVLGARLELFNYYSWSCEARPWQVWSTSPSSTGTRWGSQPAWYGHWSTSWETHGYSGSCAGGWSNADITSLAAVWASSTEYVDGWVGIKATDEGDNYGWKKFIASDNGSYIPSIWVTYNSAPTMPTGLTVSGSPNGTVPGAWTATTTPTVSFTVGDPDGQAVNFRVDVMDSAGTVQAVGGAGDVPSGSVASLKIPEGMMRNGGVYYVRAVTGDGLLLSPPTEWFAMGVDTAAPPSPSLSSTTYPNGSTWAGQPNVAGSFTVTMPPDESVTSYRWALDKAPDATQSVIAGNGAVSPLSVTASDAGRHILQVQAVDRAGNISGVAKYVFRVGQGGIVAPEDGVRVVRQVRLAVEAKPGLSYVSFRWRHGPDATTESTVPAGRLKSSAGKVWTSTCQPLPTGNSYTTWDAGALFDHRGGPAQVQARLSSSSDCLTTTPTQWVTVVVDPDADGAATTSIGPGTVNLLTGDHTLSVTDAEEFGLSLVRTTSSRDPDSGYQLQPNALTKEQQEATSLNGLDGTAFVTVDATRHHSGTTSYRLTPPAGVSDSYTSVGGDSGGLRLGMKPGRSYRMSAWVYVPEATGLSPSDGRGLSLALHTRVGSEPYVARVTPRPTIKDAWQQVSVDVTVPVGATEAFLRIYNGFSTAGAAVYFDDITVQELWSPFGPEWSLGTVDGASGSAYTRITKPYDDVAAVELTGGGEVWFTQGNADTWWPEPGAESLKLTPTSPSSWRLSELDGTVTEFSRTGTTGDFLVRTSSAPGAPGAVRSVYDVGTVPGVSRLVRLIAPIEPGVDGWPGNTQACTTYPPARGCEVLDLDYATATTAGANPGDFIGRVAHAAVWLWDGTSMNNKRWIASYQYDALGRLARVYDNRITEAGGTAQVTSYTYDSAGRLATVQAPGELPYRYTYGAAGKTLTGAGDFVDPAPGRLLKVTRASLVPGTKSQVGPDNTTTVVYGVPLTRATGGPYDLDPTAIGTWWQQDGPTDATAVFGPLDIPSTTSATATTPGPDGYRAATVSYLNASGLEVNTASPAAKNAPVEGFIDTTEYDPRGNVVRSLDATNRLLALRKLPGATASLTAWGLETKSGAELSQILSTQTEYSDDGLDVLWTLGPVQRLAVANDPADQRLLRPFTRHAYDEGKPDGAQYHLVTTTVTEGLDLTGVAVDPIVTTNAYAPVDGASPLGATSGWVHKQPTRVTVDAYQPTALTSTVVYDARGRAVRSSKPGSTGTDAATTVAVFYTAGANAEDAACGGRPEWAGQPCVTRAAGAVTGHVSARMPGDLTVKRVEGYNAYGSPTVVSDSAGSGAERVVRTATTTYDAADRVVTVAIVATGPGGGATVSKSRTSYDPATGDVVKNATLNAAGTEIASVAKEYDALGRLITYTDATGAWTKTAYDRLGQPSAVTDSLGTTRSYTYDRSVEPRGFVTKLSDSVAGDVVPTWGPDGQLESQSLPGGVKLTIGYDTARVPVTRTYTRAADGVVIASDTVVENHRGQWVGHASTDVGSQAYTYDRLGRLTRVDDRSASSGACTTRTYGFDTHTNRTSFTTATGATGASCPGTTGAVTTTSTYDSADRLVSTSGGNGSVWTYDKLGRITAMPTVDGTKVETTAYYVNDLVAAQEVSGVERTTWSLDPLQRFSQQNTFAWVNGAWANSTESVNHYDGDGDEPSWIAEDITQPDKVSRYVEGADGSVALQTGKAGGRVLQLVDLHGDIVATVPIPDGQSTADYTGLTRTAFDEFGVPKPMASAASTNAPPARYGWLGAAQRSADTPTGAILMGVRLYAPTLGRFLQVDPVAGGSANAYDYCNADPVNCTDLDGQKPSWLTKTLGAVAVIGSIASFVPGPIGVAAAAVSAVAYAANGNTAMALTMAAVSAAQLVGAGPAVRVGATALSRAANGARAAGQVTARSIAKAGRAGAGTAAAAARLVRTASTEVRHAIRSTSSIHGVFRSERTIGVRYVSSKYGSTRYLKLDKPDAIRPYAHWVRGKIQGGGKGRHVALQHYRLWGKKVN